MDLRFAELASSLQKTLGESLKETTHEMWQQNNEYIHGRGAHHMSSTYSCATRLAKIDFPRFTGDNVTQWVYQCENFFLIYGTPEEVCVELVIVHMEGKALQWHIVLTKTTNCSQLRWQDYKNLILERFAEIDEDHMEELIRLGQKKTVVEYYEEFNATIYRLHLSEGYMLSCLLGGLRRDIQMIVKMFQPSSVSKAFSLARLYEAANISTIPSTSDFRQQKGVLGSKPRSLGSSVSKEVSTGGYKDKGKGGRSLTTTYMNERRAKGLCYFCDEPYSQEHGLTHKMQVHFMEVGDDEDAGQQVMEGENKLTKALSLCREAKGCY